MSAPEVKKNPQKRGDAFSVTLEQLDANTQSILSGVRTWAKEVGLPHEPSSLLKGRHGITHYRLDEAKSENAASPRKLVVCAHGLGTNIHVYDDWIEPLTQAGYTVLRYEYFGFGWSIPNTKFFNYGPQEMAEQIEDLLDHVCNGQDERVHRFIGHSTGGVAALVAADRLDRGMNELCLVSPALWIDKPFVARVGDMLPSLFGFFGRQGLLDGAIKNAMSVNNDNAFGKDSSGKYRYEDAYLKARAAIDSQYKHHPFACAAVQNLGNCCLRGDLLKNYIKLLGKLANRDSDPARIALLWGVDDIVVPYAKYAKGSVAANPDRIKVVPLENLAHDSLYENSAPIVAAAIEFFASSASH